MREIKFRAWHPKYKLMTPRPASQQNNFEFIFVAEKNEPIGDIKSMNDFIIMQFTGLVDAHGIDIYEGDIINDHTVDADWVVTWDPEAGGWTNKDNTPFDFFLCKSLEKSLEVIGNVYENRELIPHKNKKGVSDVS